MKRKIMYLSFIFLLAAGFFSIGDSEVLAAEDDITGINLEQEMRDLIQLGILKGYSEGEYRPEEDVTRGQFAAFITRALKLPESAKGEKASFPDVPMSAKSSR